MREPGHDPLADGLGLALVPGRVVGRQGVQDEHLGSNSKAIHLGHLVVCSFIFKYVSSFPKLNKELP